MQAAGTSEESVHSLHTTHISACLRALICVVYAVEQLIALFATVTYFYARAFFPSYQRYLSRTAKLDFIYIHISSTSNNNLK
jgi:hypothetical protein